MPAEIARGGPESQAATGFGGEAFSDLGGCIAANAGRLIDKQDAMRAVPLAGRKIPDELAGRLHGEFVFADDRRARKDLDDEKG
jgi:hypothetical protein